jgi:flagellar biosynthetic protein FlhB
VLALMGPKMMEWFLVQMKNGMTGDSKVFGDVQAFLGFFNARTLDALVILCPVFAALCVGGVLSCVAVSGPNFAPNAVRLQFNAINPVEGLQKLINARAVVNLLAAILKLTFVSIIVWFYLRSRLDELAALRWAWSTRILTAIAKIILGLMIRVCIALLVIGLADSIYQKWKYTRDLMMTRQEVLEERKNFEGLPNVKRRIREIQLKMSMQRMTQEVPKANVILVNPTHVAVALRYDAATMDSPMVVAKGADHVAEKIREIARAYGVPIVRKPQLARSIYATVDLGGSIPEALYVAVAEVLAMIYRLRHRV